MDLQHLAIASVPMQPWGQIYESQTALKKGTIFQDLDMSFFAADDGGNAGCCCGVSEAGDPQQQERERLMLEIYQICFTVDDLRLYLDTHPQDVQALDMLKNSLLQRKQLLADHAMRFYPLTMDCMADIYQAGAGAGCYCWQEGPMPWEGACV